MRATDAPSTRALRGWQRRALVRYLTAKPRDFLLVATPGAGKTAFALRIAAELLADRSIDTITVVVPTEHLKTQWALAAAADGLVLDPRFSNAAAHTSAEYHGIVVTYAADAELDQVICDGASFGTATPAGSDEEADYLGIPGLLDADQMRDLLRRRQEEQLARATASGAGAHPSRLRDTGGCTHCAASSTSKSRWRTTAPASRTAASTMSCAGSAVDRRWPQRPAINSRRASKRRAG